MCLELPPTRFCIKSLDLQSTLRDILEPWRQQHSEADLYQYMDDIYIGFDHSPKHHKLIVEKLRKMLLEKGFETLNEKLQEQYPCSWMGYLLHPNKWTLQKLELPELPEKPTLNELQKKVGLLNWMSQAVPGIKTKPLLL